MAITIVHEVVEFERCSTETTLIEDVRGREGGSIKREVATDEIAGDWGDRFPRYSWQFRCGSLVCIEGEYVCVCVGARAHTRAMNIAFRYLGRANCPRECLEAVLISCQSEFGIRHARLENAFDSFSISFSSLFPLCFGKGRERKRKRRERERVECFLLCSSVAYDGGNWI